jgi:hypothetical protein
MDRRPLMETPLKSSGEHGLFNKNHWVQEARGKLISAKLLRECAFEKQSEFDSIRTFREANGLRLTSKEVFDILSVRDSARKSSILILGYAIELILKSGIVSLLINAPKIILEKTLRNYGHNLLIIAKELHLDLSPEEMSLLKTLSGYIVNETRYPVTPSSITDYCKQSNKITQFVSDEVNFTRGVTFFNRVDKVIADIDGTSENMKIHTRMAMEQNGYLTFRIGGKLPPIVIIKFCQSQIDAGTDTLETLKSLLIEKNKSDAGMNSHLMEKHWDSIVFYRVDKENLIKKLPLNIR